MIELSDLSSCNPQCESGYSLEMLEDELKMKCMVGSKIVEFVGIAGCVRSFSHNRQGCAF